MTHQLALPPGVLDGLGTPDERLNGPVGEWFADPGAAFMVLRRARLQSMPLPWQRRLVALLEELAAAYHAEPVTGPVFTPAGDAVPDHQRGYLPPDDEAASSVRASREQL